jgi:hypothetical protein
VTTYWHGVDFTVNARMSNGLVLQGGTSTGRGVRDFCDITTALPEITGVCCRDRHQRVAVRRFTQLRNRLGQIATPQGREAGRTGNRREKRIDAGGLANQIEADERHDSSRTGLAAQVLYALQELAPFFRLVCLEQVPRQNIRAYGIARVERMGGLQGFCGRRHVVQELGICKPLEQGRLRTNRVARASGGELLQRVADSKAIPGRL